MSSKHACSARTAVSCCRLELLTRGGERWRRVGSSAALVSGNQFFVLQRSGKRRGLRKVDARLAHVEDQGCEFLSASVQATVKSGANGIVQDFLEGIATPANLLRKRDSTSGSRVTVVRMTHHDVWGDAVMMH